MELFKLFGTIAVNNKEANDGIDETTGKAEESSSKFSGFLGSIGSGVGKMVGLVATGIGAAATGIAALTKSAVENYADYEQLVGGVETLFKESSDKVLEYANNAYKTAGLSSNEYMETVTSFSASLLQSLDGDTTAAAEKANMAITDMSDNANKMGTSMESIQNAYNGFSKQNYTMLDNLKLGYGGTKEEMERLLEDAEKISGFKYDISSYGDIVDAIHVVQTEMGITGTTQKEAASTISGSIGMMKASWTNFITGMADSEQDFDTLLNNLIDSVMTVADNLIPRIVQTLPRIVNGLIQLITRLATYIPNLIKELLPALIEGATQLINGVLEILPSLIDMLIESLPMLIDGVMQIMTGIVEALPEIIQMLVDALPTILPMLIDACVQLMVVMIENAPTIIGVIIEALPEIVMSVADALIQNGPILWAAIMDMMSPVIELVTDLFGTFIEVVVEFFTGLWEKITSIFNSIVEVLSGVWDSIVNGVKIGIQLIGSILSAAFQIITLPWRFIWENCKEYIFAAWEAIKSVVSKALNVISTTVSNVWNAIKTALTPILDAIKTVIETVWNAIRTAIETVVNVIKTVIETVWNAISNTVSSVMNSIRTVVSNVWDNIKSKITSVVDSIKSVVSNVFTSLKSIVTNIWNGIKTAMETPIENAKNKIKSIVDTIKGFFSGLNISFPHIKLPHFAITPSGWSIGDLLKGSIPKLGIEWYAQGGVMDGVTPFGMNGNNLMFGGEAGKEAIIPLERNTKGLDLISEKISERIGFNDNTVIQDKMNNIIELLERLLGMKITLDSGVIVGELAPAMDTALGTIYEAKERGERSTW